jgi:hypothetical protein
MYLLTESRTCCARLDQGIPRWIPVMNPPVKMNTMKIGTPRTIRAKNETVTAIAIYPPDSHVCDAIRSGVDAIPRTGEVLIGVGSQ